MATARKAPRPDWDFARLKSSLPSAADQRAASMLVDWIQASPLLAEDWTKGRHHGSVGAIAMLPGLRKVSLVLFNVTSADDGESGWVMIPWVRNNWARKLTQQQLDVVLAPISRLGMHRTQKKTGWEIPLHLLNDDRRREEFLQAVSESLEALCGVSAVAPGKGTGSKQQEEPAEENEKEPRNDEEGIKWRDQFVKARLGQGPFRRDVLNAYGGSCAISGCTVQHVLAAAHIRPCVAIGATHDVSNGLLLRSDLHLLFDQNLIAIDPQGPKVVVSPTLRKTEYGKLHDRPASLPQDGNEVKRLEFLEEHLRGLGS